MSKLTLEERFRDDIRLVTNIKWLSAEKDNMEFTTKISTFQLDAFRRLIEYADNSFKDRYE